MQNNPGEVRNNICAWDFVAPCADWFDSAAVNQVVFLCLLAVSALLFLSLIIPPLTENYRQTVTEIARFAPLKKPPEPLRPKAVKRDVWLSDAMIYVLRGRWGDRPGLKNLAENELGRFFEIEKEFRQAALDAKLPIWGKRAAYRLWEEVLAEDWASYDFSEFDLQKSLADPEKLIVVRVGGRFPTQEWVRVMTSKAKVEELWPMIKAGTG